MNMDGDRIIVLSNGRAVAMHFGHAAPWATTFETV